MIDFINVSKHFGTQDVLLDVSLRINAGEKVGIVGPNGAGKSTLFNLLTREIGPDAGTVSLPKNLRIGYLRQQLRPHLVRESLLEYAENAVAELRQVELEMTRLEHLVGTPGEATPERLRQLGELHGRFEHLGGYTLRNRAEATLSGLGFAVAAFANPFASFSGGWQMRAELARVLVSAPDMLLLDEPTNYLDVPAIEWLQGFLRSFPGTLLLISHDRYLLNILCTTTVEVANCRATRYLGNYEYYAAERENRHAQLLAAKQNQDRKREQLERFVDRFRAKSSKAAQAQSRIKQLDKMEDIALPQEMLRPARIRLAKPARAGAEIVRLEDAGLSYDGQRFVFRHLDFRLERGTKAAVIGLNGMGKTTLLRVLAGHKSLSEGKRQLGTGVEVGYQSQDFTDTMDPTRTVFQTAKAAAPERSESEIRSLLGSFRFGGDAVDKPVEVLSGGEKVRLALARLLLSCPNFLLLDEPTTHLDIPSRQSLEEALRDYEGTLCLVSHDIEFIRHVATTIFDLTPQGVVRYYGDYDYYKGKTADQSGGGARREIDDVLEVIEEQKNGDRKSQRREAAERRQQLSRQLKPLKERSATAVKRVETLEAEQAAMLAKLGAGQATSEEMASFGRRLKELPAEIEQATAAWEAAELAIEAVKTAEGE